MIVTDFRIVSSCTPSNTILYGSTATISFKVRRESADRFNNGLYVWYDTGYGEALAYMNTAFSLNAGETAEIEVQSEAFSDRYIETQLGSNRAYSRTNWGVQFGMNGSRANVTFPVNFVRGWLPKIEYFSAERCTNGALSDEGENLLCGLRASVSGAAELAEMSLRLYYATGAVTAASPSVDLTDWIEAAITGIADSASLIERTFSNGSDWNLMLAFGDAYEQSIVYVSIPRAFANVHLSGCATGGVAFGKFSSATEGEPKFECEYPAYFSAPATFGAGIAGVPRIEFGQVGGEASVAAGGYQELTIAFAQAYQTPPVVLCGFWSGSTAGGFGRCSAASFDVTTTGCKARVYNGDSSARTPSVTWIAVGT